MQDQVQKVRVVDLDLTVMRWASVQIKVFLAGLLVGIIAIPITTVIGILVAMVVILALAGMGSATG